MKRIFLKLNKAFEFIEKIEDLDLLKDFFSIDVDNISTLSDALKNRLWIEYNEHYYVEFTVPMLLENDTFLVRKVSGANVFYEKRVTL